MTRSPALRRSTILMAVLGALLLGGVLLGGVLLGGHGTHDGAVRHGADAPVPDTAPGLRGAIRAPADASGTSAPEEAERPVGASRGHLAAADTEPGALDHVRGGRPLTESHADVAPVIAVQDRWTQRLFRHPAVVGTATGLDARGNVAVIVLVRTPTDDLPRVLDGVPVETFVSGDLVASKGGPPADKGGGGGGGGTKVDPTARFDRPVPIGVSTGHPAITAGTIGCRVKAGSDVYALSNNHVYADENQANLGDDVIQPGTYDGGKNNGDDDLGTLDAFVAIAFVSISGGGANEVDAAIALSDSGSLGTATPADGYGTPRTTTVAAAINQRVTKYGRTTGETNGRVYAINASVNIGYSTGTAGFVDQIIVTPGSFSSGGDSGSLIVVQKGSDARKPVGLLFAGSNTITIANPIDTVLNAFGVTIDGDTK